MELARRIDDRGAAPGNHPGCGRDLRTARSGWDDAERASSPALRGLAGELADWVESFYVGLDRVRARGFDPVVALRRARRLRDIERAFAWLEDRHTFVSVRELACHRGPGLHADRGSRLDLVGTLQLPVRVGSAFCSQQAVERERFWIREVAEGAEGAAMGLPQRGDEVTHWNGVPLERVVRRLGAELRGAHAHARRRLGLRALTRRVVEAGRLPDEDWVVLTCRRDGSQVHHRLEWSDRALQWPSRPPCPAESVWGDRIRIGHFGEPDEMPELLERLATRRTHNRPLLLDLRGNAGGSVHGMLAVFHEVVGRPADERLRFQFRESERLSRELCRLSRRGRRSTSANDGFMAAHRIDDPTAARYRSIDGRARAGRDASEPQRASGACRKLGVLVDASTFSAAEILTALLRGEGASVFGTDPCTGDGPENAWSLPALRRLCPDEWIEAERGPDETIRAYCADHGLISSASWAAGASRHWRLCAAPSGARPHRDTRLAVWNPDLDPDAIAMHVMESGLDSATGFGVDLQLSVRRPLILLGGVWVPVERQDVDHLLRPTVRDLLEDDVDLLKKAFCLLAGDARVAPSRSETPAPPFEGSGRPQPEESRS